MEIKHLNIPVTGEQKDRLEEVKGNRSWQKAIMEEFGVEE